MKRVSIRWRIMIWNTAAFAVVLLGFGVLVYSLLRQTHYDQLDRALTNRLRELSEDKQFADTPRETLAAWIAGLEQRTGVAGVVVSPDGITLARSDRLRPLTTFDVPVPLTSQPRFDSLVLPDGERMRRLSAAVPVGDGMYAVVLLAELEHLDEELDLVMKTLFITIPITLIVAAGLAYLLAYRALAPVEHLRQQADEITAERLDRRLPVHHSSDELGLLAQTINSMIERLEGSFEEVRRFTADASHELRTPIAVIRSEAEMGVDAIHNPENARRRFDSILEECTRLAVMTSQLLTLSREDSGVVPGANIRIAVAGLLRETVESLHPRAEVKRQQITLTIKDEPEVLGDPERLRQVFHNLLDNAIKYTPEEGRISVTLERATSAAAITFEDNGSGISAEHLPRIFDRYYRVDKSSGEGAGLGLSIVQSIVKSFSGRVEVESSPGKGSKFRALLPCGDLSDSLTN